MPHLITCEHASCALPRELRGLYGRDELQSHRGFDIGASAVAVLLARRLGTQALLGKVSRLAIDLNRSQTHPQLFGHAVRSLPINVRKGLLETYYAPHWRRVALAVQEARAKKRLVVHLAAHSFTPILNGHVRTLDIGILFDPKRPIERQLAINLRRALKVMLPHLVIRLNQPYLGASDGLPTALRKKTDARTYVGIELEVNQALVFKRSWPSVREQLVAAVAWALSFGAHRNVVMG